jgi:phosphatidylglycerophosphate synthase
LFVLLFWFKIENKVLILSLFCFGALTDLIDGPVARGLDKVTEFGAMLDPVADKMLIMPIAVYSLFYHHKWLLLSLILIELSNALVTIFYKSKKPYLESDIFGKTKMFFLSISFVGILFAWPLSPFQFFINILWLSIPLSLFSIFIKLSDVGSLKIKGKK